MRLILTILILIIYFPAFSQSTDEGKVEGWNYIATIPADWDSTKASPALIFFPGLGSAGRKRKIDFHKHQIQLWFFGLSITSYG